MAGIFLAATNLTQTKQYVLSGNIDTSEPMAYRPLDRLERREEGLIEIDCASHNISFATRRPRHLGQNGLSRLVLD